MIRMKNPRFRCRIRRFLRGGSRGLTLIEIVIAMTLMSFIVVGFLGGLSNAIGHLHFSDVRTTAESLARSEMERVKEARYRDYDPSDPPPYSSAPEESSVYVGYYVEITAFPVDPEKRTLIVDPSTGQFLEGYDKDLGLQEITVIVSHGGRDVVSLTSYRTDR